MSQIEIVKERKLIPLAKLPERINRECAAINRSAVELLHHILMCGDYLNQAKMQLPYGGFTQWLETYCELGHAQAHRYMRIATMFPRIPGSKQKRASELTSFRQILSLVTGDDLGKKKSGPDPERGDGPPSRRLKDSTLKRLNDCGHRGCVRPQAMMGFCSDHFMDELITNLRYVSREELEQLSHFLNQSLSGE